MSKIHGIEKVMHRISKIQLLLEAQKATPRFMRPSSQLKMLSYSVLPKLVLKLPESKMFLLLLVHHSHNWRIIIKL